MIKAVVHVFNKFMGYYTDYWIVLCGEKLRKNNY